jgi:hypothetical protein
LLNKGQKGLFKQFPRTDRVGQGQRLLHQELQALRRKEIPVSGGSLTTLMGCTRAYFEDDLPMNNEVASKPFAEPVKRKMGRPKAPPTKVIRIRLLVPDHKKRWKHWVATGGRNE